jgi:hypothetical protein
VQVAVVARAVGGLGDKELSEADRAKAVAALAAQAADPATPAGDRLELVRAMFAVGKGAERAYLRSTLVLERADPAFAKEPQLVEVIVTSLAAGGREDRETVRFVARDPRSDASVAAAAKAALAAP